MDCSAGVGTNLRRWARVSGILALALIGVSCGDQFRPVAIPITPPPPDPASFHFVLVLSDNGLHDPGASSRVDVSGDTNIGVAQLGLGPAHAALTPSGSRVFVANSLEDSVSSYAPGNANSVTTTSLPSGSNPVFVHTAENSTVYVANFGTGTVAAISTASNFVSDIIRVDPSQPVPDPISKPVALVEMPDGKKLYAVNQGSGKVSSISLVDRTVVQMIATGTTPVWAVARSDNARVYVLDSATGTVFAINTLSDQIVGTATTGAGANYMTYDSSLNRVYVTNPVANTLTALDISKDPPAPLFAIPIAASPITVAALPGGSRIYVASVSSSGGTAISQVTVVNASNGSVRTVIPLNSVPTTCSAVRFELFIAASADSSKVYVGNCDAGNTSIIRTSDEQKLLDMPAPLSVITPPNGGNPLPQNPVFVVAGP
jgi:YVTN family beta-propeller protein